MTRYLIIGMGAAGFSAAETIRAGDPNGDIILISEERDGYYSRPGLAYYLTGEIDESMLFPISDSELRHLRAKRIHAKVNAILPADKQIRFSTGATMKFDRLLIAMGAVANRPTWPGSDLENVHKLDNIADARRLIRNCKGIRTAVVIGGGVTALELVEGLLARRKKVHYLLRRHRYWSNVLDETESRIVERRLMEAGVQIHFHTEVSDILGKRGEVIGVRTSNGKILKCQLVGVAIGIRPRIELAKAAGLETDRGILVSERLQTSKADIYAAGDVAQVFDPNLGKSVVDSLWGPACEQGRVAGKNMTGQAVCYKKKMPFNVTRLAGLTTTIIGRIGKGDDFDLTGIARGDSETWRELPDTIAAQSHFDENRMRVVLNQKHLLGAIVMGDQTLSIPLQTLISEKVDISGIRAALVDPRQHPADVLTNFWIQHQAYQR